MSTHIIDTTEIDVELIAEVAQNHDMGAGALKGALESGSSPQSDSMKTALTEVRARHLGVDPEVIKQA